MHKRRAASSLIIAGALSLGFVASQIAGATPGFAATKPHAAKAHAKKHAGTTKHATSSTAAHADGTIVSVSTDGNTLTVKPDSDAANSTEYTKVTKVILNGSTKYSTGKGATTSTKPAIAAGQRFVAEGALSAGDTTLTATLFGIHADRKGHGGDGHGKGGPHADGIVAGISQDGNTIAITPDANDAAGSAESKITTIQLTSTTVYGGSRGAAPSTTRPTIAQGNFIMAVGTLNAAGTTLTATRAFVSTTAPGKH